MMEFEYPNIAEGDLETVLTSSVLEVGYDNGLPFVRVKCGCGKNPKLRDETIIACQFCGRDMENLFYAGLRSLKNSA